MEFDPNQLRDAFLEQSAVFLDLVRSAGDLGAPTALEGWDAVDPSVIADFARRYAQKRSHQDMRDKIVEAVTRSRQVVTDTPPDLIMSIAGGAGWGTFDQVLATRIFELTVHGLDLAAAIESEASMAPSALAIAGGILDSRLDGDRPGDISGNTDWILAGTGRIPHTDPRLRTVS